MTVAFSEVRTLHSLDHANVLKFYAWYETSAHLWLVLEYCVGGDLLTLLRQDTRLPEESIHDFARDLVQALQFLHSKGVIYCDLKPSNVLLDENGRLKLCDFGLARRLSDISKSSVQQLPQAKRGTPCYMAPELFQEGGVHSFASDLWALGCVMYECFAGRPPFVSSSFTHLVNAILSDATPALQGNPSKEFEDLILCLLTKDPAKRLQWSELCQHPFWRVKLKPLPLPPQPAFANSLRLLQRMSTSGADGGAHGLSTNAQKKSSHDQHASRLERAIKKAETQVGQRKNSATPSRDTDSAATHANCTGAHKKPCHDQAVPRMEKPVKRGESQPAQRNPSVTPSRDTDACENIPASKQSNPMEVRNLPPLKEDSRQKNCAVNILRLSRIVKCNLQRETQGGNSGQQASNAPANDTDVTIDNNDLELDFAERVEGDSNDDDDEVADVPPSADGAGCSEDIDAGGAPSFVKDDEQIRLQCDKGPVVSGAERESEALEKSNGARKKAEGGRVAVAATPPGVARKARRVPIHPKKRGVDRKPPAPATTRWL